MVDKRILIIHTMTRFFISYDEACILVDNVFKEGKQEEYAKYLMEFPTYLEVLKKYGGDD